MRKSPLLLGTLLLISVASVQAIAVVPESVERPSHLELRAEFSSHQRRVQMVGPHIVRIFSDFFPWLSKHPALVMKRLALHDFVKTLDIDSLRRLGYGRKADVASELIEFYGVGEGRLTNDQRQRLDQLKNDFNELERNEKRRLMIAHGFSEAHPIEREFGKLEAVIDSVDIKQFRRHEFGLHDPHHVSGAAWMLKNNFPPDWVLLARLLEPIYRDLIRSGPSATACGLVLQ